MMAWFQRLNLTPQERRLVLVGLVVVALLVNYWLVWPYFGEWGRIGAAMTKLEAQKTRYFQEISRKAGYEARLQRLRSEGAEVPTEEMANLLQGRVTELARKTGVQITRTTPQTRAARTGRSGQTNEFFEERVLKIDLQSGEPELVEFLWELGSGTSPVRVRDIGNLRLDPTQTRLACSLDLVASFPRSTPPPAKPGAAAGAVRRPSP